jgi:hypothetical protein
MSMQRSILKNKKKNLDITPSPYTPGTSLNKMANAVAAMMQANSKESFASVYNKVMTRKVIATHNQGEFRRYPENGKPGCLRELMKLAVGKKLGFAIK